MLVLRLELKNKNEDPKVWANLTTGAWCYYNNKKENGAKYGKLYNWYAVTDQRGLAPEGFPIPIHREIEKLIEDLDGENLAVEKLMSKDGWFG